MSTNRTVTPHTGIGYDGVTVTIDDDTDRVLTLVGDRATAPVDVLTQALNQLTTTRGQR